MHIEIRLVPRACAAFLFLSSVASAAFAGGGTNGATQRVSVDFAGNIAPEFSRGPSISRDGRYVAFESDSGLVPFDLNTHTDIYVRDLQNGTVQIVSRRQDGVIGNADSHSPAISGDGRYVAFATAASNLVLMDGNGALDVLLKDLVTSSLVRVSTSAGGVVAADAASFHPSVSFDGRFVAFQSAANDLHPQGVNAYYDIFVRDMQTGSFTCASRGQFGPSNGHSYDPSISDDGAFVAFHTEASNSTLSDLNGVTDVVVRNLALGGAERVSKDSNGVSANGASIRASLSADGRFVAFSSSASNLVAGDTNGFSDVFLRDRTLDTTVLVSRATDGSMGNGSSNSPSISADGRTIAFASSAQNIAASAPPFASVYVRDVDRAETYLACRPSGPTSLPNDTSGEASLSGDGLLVAFTSLASNLAQADLNGVSDVFVRTMFPDPIAYCTPSETSAGCTPNLSSSGLPRASQDNGFVVTCSDVPNNKLGLMFYGLGGRFEAPFQAGTLCVKLPVVRTPVTLSGGNPPPGDDCSGSFQIDMNAFAQGLLGVAPRAELSEVGQRVNLQYWGRDPQGALATTFLSDALEYVVGP